MRVFFPDLILKFIMGIDVLNICLCEFDKENIEPVSNRHPAVRAFICALSFISSLSLNPDTLGRDRLSHIHCSTIGCLSQNGIGNNRAISGNDIEGMSSLSFPAALSRTSPALAPIYPQGEDEKLRPRSLNESGCHYLV